jgi:putative membrane protein insertion efficiency factor
MKKICLILINIYQTFISPLLIKRCRFYPSCSNYASEAIENHGTFKGLYLATCRILRCHPFSEGGVDHVPSKGAIK